MPSPILLLLLALAMLHTSMAIKCISQPDKDGADEEYYKVWKIPGNQIKWKDLMLKAMNRSVPVDCAEIARERNFTEPSHCFSVNTSSCPRVVHFSDSTFDPEVGPNFINTFGIGFVNATHENFCDFLKKELGCPSCYVCNETDFCNAGPEKAGTGMTVERLRNLP